MYEPFIPDMENRSSTTSIKRTPNRTSGTSESTQYRLDDQIGYVLRLANQRHLDIYSNTLSELTPTQFSLLYRLSEVNELPQNELGRRVAMDAATTNGVIERLGKKKLISSRTDPSDRRRRLISLTAKGRRITNDAVSLATQVSAETLMPLSTSEANTLVRLLKKISHSD